MRLNKTTLSIMLGIVLLTGILGAHHSEVQGKQINLPIVPSRHLFDLKADFLHPSDVTVGPNGNIYVLDGVNSKVSIFTSDGTYVSSFGSRGSNDGEFNKPLGLDSCSDGTIYVADSGNRRVQVFDRGGRFVYKFNIVPKDTKSLSDPADIVVDEKMDRSYVIDNDNHIIMVYTKDGSRLLEQWGKRGEKPGEFMHPFLAALDSRSTLYVVDVLNSRVQALNHEGRTMSIIGKWGVDRGQFYRPRGVAVDIKERIYVSDSYLGVVQVFKRYKKFLGVLGNQEGDVLNLKTPTGIYVDNNMRIYVVEMVKNIVSVYQIIE